MAVVADHFEAFAKAVFGIGEALVGLFAIDKQVGLVKAPHRFVARTTADAPGSGRNCADVDPMCAR